LQFSQRFEPLQFTGKERDSDPASITSARGITPTDGPVCDPDWAPKQPLFRTPSSPIHNHSLDSYVRNIPTTKYDADGHFVVQDDQKKPPPQAQNQSPGGVRGFSKSRYLASDHGGRPTQKWLLNKLRIGGLVKATHLRRPEMFIGAVMPIGGAGGAAVTRNGACQYDGQDQGFWSRLELRRLSRCDR